MNPPPLPTDALTAHLDRLPYPTVFATVSGSHLYGFPSADSDFDLRASHVLPADALFSLHAPKETEEWQLDGEAGLVEGVSHDLRKFARLLLKRNGYVLEQLTSPLVVRSTPAHLELLSLVPGLLTRSHYHHYRGFYHTERREYDRSNPRSVKKLLYCFRVLMTGCVLLREAVVEANLLALNHRFGVGLLDDLIAIKTSAERAGVPDDPAYVRELERLEGELDRAFAESTLPEEPSVYAELDALLIRVRQQGVGEMHAA
jgi:predicted nucleotidyltransferase